MPELTDSLFECWPVYIATALLVHCSALASFHAHVVFSIVSSPYTKSVV